MPTKSPTVSHILPELLILLAVAAPAGAEKPPERINYGAPRLLANLENERIVESSGLARSRRTDGVFWTHNDSGHGPFIYALNRDGEDLATFEIAGIEARDLEDIASFRMNDTPYLLLGDVGDNHARRETVSLHLIIEPALREDGEPTVGQIEPEQTIRFRYETGPVDCEAVAFDPEERKIYLVGKVLWHRARVYELPLPDDDFEGVAVAKPVANVPIPLATGMDISADNTRCIVVTYGPAFEFIRRPDETWAEAFQREPRRLMMPMRRQGEAICYGPDDRSLYLTSEGRPCPLWEVPAVDDD